MKEQLSTEEYQAYWDMLEKTNPNRRLQELNVHLDGEFAELTYKFEPVDFERIRRITGYLVPDTSKWNEGKKAELDDRIVHHMTEQLPGMSVEDLFIKTSQE